MLSGEAADGTAKQFKVLVLGSVTCEAASGKYPCEAVIAEASATREAG